MTSKQTHVQTHVAINAIYANKIYAINSVMGARVFRDYTAAKFYIDTVLTGANDNYNGGLAA